MMKTWWESLSRRPTFTHAWGPRRQTSSRCWTGLDPTPRRRRWRPSRKYSLPTFASRFYTDSSPLSIRVRTIKPDLARRCAVFAFCALLSRLQSAAPYLLCGFLRCVVTVFAVFEVSQKGIFTDLRSTKTSKQLHTDFFYRSSSEIIGKYVLPEHRESLFCGWCVTGMGREPPQLSSLCVLNISHEPLAAR